MTRRHAMAMALLAALAACAVNPATGRRELSLIGEREEIAMGREADEQVTASLGLVDDPALQEYVSQLGQRLAAESERPDLPWSFKVVDDPVVNAFALPGGFIFVTRGILAHFDSEAELAGVLGHEIGHVTARHSASQMSRQRLQSFGLGVGSLLSEQVRRYGDVLGAGLGMLNLRYSRQDESESDALGLRYLNRTGYDADAMIGVFEMLAEVGGGGSRLPEWQLTHPYPENREADVRRMISENGIAPGGTVARDALLDRVDGLVYGENPRDGYFSGRRFNHPDLAFSVEFPAGWTTANQRTAVVGVGGEEAAVAILGLVETADGPAQALASFLAADGMVAGSTRRNEEGGIERARATFEWTTSDGVFVGEVAFIAFEGRTFRLIGYSTPSLWDEYARGVAEWISSFARLTDRDILEVQPRRLSVVRLGSASSLNSWVSRNPQPISIEDLARLNRTSPGAVLPAGRRIKVVVGQTPR